MAAPLPPKQPTHEPATPRTYKPTPGERRGGLLGGDLGSQLPGAPTARRRWVDWVYSLGNALAVAIAAASVAWAADSAQPVVAAITGVLVFAGTTFTLVLLRT